MRLLSLSLSLVALIGASSACASDVVRYPLPNHNSFPISAAVEVPAGKALVFLSGQVAMTPKGELAKDTEAQTVAVLQNIRKQLQAMHLGLGDVVKMQAFLVGDETKGGKLDFAGFMAGYTQFFGTKEQPSLPARTAVQVAALADPDVLIEIDVIAVRR